MNRAVLAAVTLAGCFRTHQLPAPPPPERRLPAIAVEGEPAPGLGRVVLDVQEGPAVVERIQGASATGIAGSHVLSGSIELARRVCITPCVLDVPPGPQELRFTLVDDYTRTSTGYVNVDTRPGAYRHAIGTQRNRAWKGFVGWPVLLLGVVLDLGLTTVIAKGEFEANGPNIAGTGISLGLTVLGGWLVGGSVVEQQAGSGVAWHP